MPTPHFERATLTEREKERRGDPFKPPYNPNLYVGELRDEDEGTEYVVLVSEFWLLLFFLLFVGNSYECEPTLLLLALLLHPLHTHALL